MLRVSKLRVSKQPFGGRVYILTKALKNELTQCIPSQTLKFQIDL